MYLCFQLTTHRATVGTSLLSSLTLTQINNVQDFSSKQNTTILWRLLGTFKTYSYIWKLHAIYVRFSNIVYCTTCDSASTWCKRIHEVYWMNSSHKRSNHFQLADLHSENAIHWHTQLLLLVSNLLLTNNYLLSNLSH